MSLHFTEEELKLLGYRKDKDGKWRRHAPDWSREANSLGRDTSEVSKLESNSLNAAKRKNAAKKNDEDRSGKSYRIIVTARCRRYVDPDNLNPKWFIDRLKEFRIIPDDGSKYVTEFVKRVVKIKSYEKETTLIEVYESRSKI